MKTFATILASMLLLINLFAEEKKPRIIEADKETSGSILAASREVVRVKFTNHNSFPIEVALIGGILEKRDKNDWVDLRDGFRDFRSPAEIHTKTAVTVEAGATVEIDFRPAYDYWLKSWNKGDMVRLVIPYWRLKEGKRTGETGMALTESYRSEQVSGGNGGQRN